MGLFGFDVLGLHGFGVLRGAKDESGGGGWSRWFGVEVGCCWCWRWLFGVDGGRCFGVGVLLCSLSVKGVDYLWCGEPQASVVAEQYPAGGEGHGLEVLACGEAFVGPLYLHGSNEVEEGVAECKNGSFHHAHDARAHGEGRFRVGHEQSGEGEGCGAEDKWAVFAGVGCDDERGGDCAHVGDDGHGAVDADVFCCRWRDAVFWQ